MPRGRYGPYAYAPDWFNNDDNFARIMQETLYLQRELITEVKKLDVAMDTPPPISRHLPPSLTFHPHNLPQVKKLDAAMDKPDLSLKGWKARGPARLMLLSGWCFARAPSSGDFAIDLRDAALLPSDGVQLAKLLDTCPKLTSVDVVRSTKRPLHAAQHEAPFLACSIVRDRPTHSHAYASVRSAVMRSSMSKAPRR